MLLCIPKYNLTLPLYNFPERFYVGVNDKTCSGKLNNTKGLSANSLLTGSTSNNFASGNYGSPLHVHSSSLELQHFQPNHAE